MTIEHNVPCGLPDAADCGKMHTPAPAPCVEEYCEQPIQIIPYCPPCAMPLPPRICGILEEGCDWTPSCAQSIPREIGCSPLVTGWGAYDGGVPSWARDGFCEDNCDTALRRALDPTRPWYSPGDWESFLDLNTHSEFNVRLQVWRNGHPNRISPQEFTALAHKILQLAHCHGLVASPQDLPQPALMSLGMVVTGTDANGKPTYGLSNLYNGSSVGTPMPLVTERDAAGIVTGIRLPHELAVADEAAA